MDQIGGSRPGIGLAWLASDPSAVATRLAVATGIEVPVERAVSVGGLALTVRATSPAESADRLEVVARGDMPTGIWLGELAVGWATVDLERAGSQLIAGGLVDDLNDQIEVVDALGAAARRADRSAFGVPLLLLEPTTEGHLAATLARHGEGPCAIVIGNAAAGRAGLVAGGSRGGPHLLVHGGGYHRRR